MDINPIFQITFQRNGKYISSMFYIENDLYEFRCKSNIELEYRYLINDMSCNKEIWENRVSEVYKMDYQLMQSNLIKFGKLNGLIELKDIHDDVSIKFQVGICPDNFKYGSLNFLLKDNHQVGFNNYLQKVNFQSNIIKEAFKKILNKIDETLSTDNFWNLMTQDVVVFEEYIKVTSKISIYFGFADKAPYSEPIKLFKIPTINLLTVIDSFIRFIDLNKIEK